MGRRGKPKQCGAIQSQSPVAQATGNLLRRPKLRGVFPMWPTACMHPFLLFWDIVAAKGRVYAHHGHAVERLFRGDESSLQLESSWNLAACRGRIQ
eukprot:264456-Chlamydomonas_euryale.AAC.4